MRTTSHNRRTPGAALAVAAAVLLVLATAFFRNAATGAMMSVVAPLLSLRNALSVGEVGQLRAELASTTAALADHDVLAAENAQLRAELGRLPARGAGASRALLAGVIEHPPGTPYDTFLVDAGSGLGVRVGAEVWAGGVVIGRVDSVYASTARITLYSAPGQSYQALLITGTAAVPVGVEGQGAGSMQASVPAGTPVAVGNKVVFPGIAGGVLAQVSAVSAPEGESFKTIYLHVPVNIFELRFVYIAL